MSAGAQEGYVGICSWPAVEDTRNKYTGIAAQAHYDETNITFRVMSVQLLSCVFGAGSESFPRPSN